MSSQISITKPNDIKINNCKFQELLVGRSIKGTKRKLCWEFDVSGKKHNFELFDSKLSGKKKVVANGTIIFPPKVIRSLFSFTFYLESYLISILQNGNNFECRINNLPFSHLIELEKNKKNFSNEGTSPSSTNSNKSSDEDTKQTQELSKFEISENKENSKNEQNNAQFKVVIKERRDSNQSAHDEIFAEAEKISKQFFTFNLEGFEPNVKKEKNENLIDFSSTDGSKPSKLNILELSLNTQLTDNESARQSPDSNSENVPNLFEDFFSNSDKNFPTDFSVKESKTEKTSKENVNDINDFFDTFNLSQPKKEMSKIDKIKEMYQSSFVENEGSKIDPIYNVFGGPSFSVYNNYQMGRMSLANTSLGGNLMNKFDSTNNMPLFEKKETLNNSEGVFKKCHSSKEVIPTINNNSNPNTLENLNSNDSTTNCSHSEKLANGPTKSSYPSFNQLPNFQLNKQKSEMLKESPKTNNIFDIFM